MNSTWLITSELANQRARKVLFTCVVYTKSVYSWGEGNIIASSYMSISSWIINLDMNSEESCFFCIALQA